MPFTARLLLAALSGICMALAFPNYGLAALGWISIALLMLACARARLWQAALCGVLQGVIFYSASLAWIYTVMRTYGGLDSGQAAGVLGLLSAAGGLFPLLFGLVFASLSRRRLGWACGFAPFFWVSLEFARTHLPIIGFPWNLIGYVSSRQLGLLQIAAWTGIYGLSFLVAAYSAVLAWAALERTPRSGLAVLGLTGLLVLAMVAVPLWLPAEHPGYVARLIQTNFPQSEHYPPDWLMQHQGEMEQLQTLSIGRAAGTDGLVVWPEVPAPFTLADAAFANIAGSIARRTNGDFLVGIVDWRYVRGREPEAYNSAILLNAAGQRVFTYYKIHLVPFGEYVPLREWIKFAGRLTADISDFTPGSAYSVGSLPGGQFSVFICYEAIFPDEVRQFTRHGAQLLINISNDGWFGRSAAPAQHLMMARVRAVENRRWLLRDTNNGFTVDVDPYGRIMARLATDVRGELNAPYGFRGDQSLYVRWGDWFAWLCVVGAVLLCGLACWPRPRPAV